MMRTLALLLFSALASAATPVACAAAAPQELAPGVHWLPGRFVAGAQPDGNSLVFDGSRALIVFDSGRHAAHTQAIVDYAHARGEPVAAIVNSHWHLDHVGGNALLRREFPQARVYASAAIEKAMHGFLANYRSQLEDMLGKSDAAQQAMFRDEIALIDAGPVLYPTDPVRAPGDRTLAGRRVRFGYERAAVTGGDVWLFDPATRILAAGDLVTLPAPLLDTACPAHWQAALKRIGAVEFDRLVPGHGAPMQHAQFDTYRVAFDHLLACAAGTDAKAVCSDGWMHDADALIPETDRALARSLLDYYIDQRLRGDAALLAKDCAV